MSNPGSILSAGAVKISDVVVVALYEPLTGRILHVHTSIRHVGAEALDEAEAVETAQRHASAVGHDPESLHVAVSRSLEHASEPHRVDPATGEFRALASPS